MIRNDPMGLDIQAYANSADPLHPLDTFLFCKITLLKFKDNYSNFFDMSKLDYTELLLVVKMCVCVCVCVCVLFFFFFFFFFLFFVVVFFFFVLFCFVLFVFLFCFFLFCFFK